MARSTQVPVQHWALHQQLHLSSFLVQVHQGKALMMMLKMMSLASCTHHATQEDVKISRGNPASKGDIQHKDIAGQVQSGRRGHSLVVEEVYQKEQATMYIRSVAQARQGQ